MSDEQEYVVLTFDELDALRLQLGGLVDRVRRLRYSGKIEDLPDLERLARLQLDLERARQRCWPPTETAGT